MRFDFLWEDRWRTPLRLLGITESSAWVELTDHLTVRFGRWSLATPISNITGVEQSGDYRWYRAIGPHLSLKDRGVSFGTNLRQGVCLRFEQPVPALFPFGWIPHPGCTVTIDDVDGFLAALSSAHGEFGS